MKQNADELCFGIANGRVLNWNKMWYKNVKHMCVFWICVFMKLSNYAILHFLVNIEIRFPIFTSSLDFNNCINLNMLGLCNALLM